MPNIHSIEQLRRATEQIMEGEPVKVPTLHMVEDIAREAYQTHGQYIMFRSLTQEKVFEVHLLHDESVNFLEDWNVVPYDMDLPSHRNYCNICKNEDPQICQLCGGKGGRDD